MAESMVRVMLSVNPQKNTLTRGNALKRTSTSNGSFEDNSGNHQYKSD